MFAFVCVYVMHHWNQASTFLWNGSVLPMTIIDLSLLSTLSPILVVVCVLRVPTLYEADLGNSSLCFEPGLSGWPAPMRRKRNAFGYFQNALYIKILHLFLLIDKINLLHLSSFSSWLVCLESLFDFLNAFRKRRLIWSSNQIVYLSHVY
jgi:hypothetical protein